MSLLRVDSATHIFVVDSYLSFLKARETEQLGALVLWSLILLNSFFPGAFFLSIALAADLIRRCLPRDVLTKLIATVAIIMLVELPIAWFCRIWDRRFGTESGFGDPMAWSLYLFRYVLTLNNYFFPLIVIVAACLLKWRSIRANKIFENELNFLSLVVCATGLIGFSIISDYPFTRYITGIAPFVMFLGATCVEAVASNRNWLIWPLAALIAMTNVLHILPLPLLRLSSLQNPQWNTAGVDLHFLDTKNLRASFARGEVKALINVAAACPFLDYLRSIIHPPAGPIDLIVEYLRKNAAPTDRVKVSYGDLPLMFHTDLTITGSTETGPPGPEWIISRYFRPLRMDDEFFRQNSGYHFRPFTIPFPDLQWNNQPDPLYHYYNTPAANLAPPITILRKF